MRGTILKRAKGSWTIIIDVGKHPDGSRKQQWITVKGSKRDAERRLAEILNKVNSGLYIRPSKDTLGSFLETWLKDHISTRVRPTTLDGYRWRAKRHHRGIRPPQVMRPGTPTHPGLPQVQTRPRVIPSDHHQAPQPTAVFPAYSGQVEAHRT